MDTMTPPPGAPQPRPWFKKKWVWAVTAVAVIAIGSAGAGSEKKEAKLTASGQVTDSTQSTSAAAPEQTTAPTAAPTTATTAKATTTTTAKPATTTTEKLDSCAEVREALLTGTQAQIDKAMAAVMADKSAPDTAREYADYYLHRDAPGASKDMREMDVGLIRMACS